MINLSPKKYHLHASEILDAITPISIYKIAKMMRGFSFRRAEVVEGLYEALSSRGLASSVGILADESSSLSLATSEYGSWPPQVIDKVTVSLSIRSSSFNAKIGRRPSTPHLYRLQALHDLVSHSHCSLSSLRLLETPLNRHLSGILERSPKLASLSLEFFQWGRTDDVCLRSIIAHGGLMPHLRTLIFLRHFIRVGDMDETAAKFVDAVFVDAVAARWKSSFLKTVHIDVDLPVSLSSADVARLKGLKEEGLGISLCAKSFDGSKIIL